MFIGLQVFDLCFVYVDLVVLGELGDQVVFELGCLVVGGEVDQLGQQVVWQQVLVVDEQMIFE